MRSSRAARWAAGALQQRGLGAADDPPSGGDALAGRDRLPDPPRAAVEGADARHAEPGRAARRAGRRLEAQPVALADRVRDLGDQLARLVTHHGAQLVAAVVGLLARDVVAPAAPREHP